MDPDEFSDTYLTKLINSTTNSKKTIILTGDFNFNLLKYGNHNHNLFRFTFQKLIYATNHSTN